MYILYLSIDGERETVGYATSNTKLDDLMKDGIRFRKCIEYGSAHETHKMLREFRDDIQAKLPLHEINEKLRYGHLLEVESKSATAYADDGRMKELSFLMDRCVAAVEADRAARQEKIDAERARTKKK